MFNSNTLIVDHLYDSIKNSKNVVESFKACIKEGAWKEYKSKLDKNITHKDFIEFITADYPHGLETTPDTLRELIKHDLEALTMFSELITAPKGGNRRSVDFKLCNPKFETNNNNEYALRVLHKQKPELYDKVINKELSVNEAMIKAGKRKIKRSVVMEKEKVVFFIKKYFDNNDIQYIKNNL